MKKVGWIGQLFLIATLLLTGCGNGSSAQGTSQLAEPPQPVIEWSGKTAVTVPASSCWSYNNESICKDMAAPPELVAEHKPAPLQVRPGATMTITFAQQPTTNTLKVTQWNGMKEVEQVIENGNQWKAPEQPGWYLFDVRGQWAQGDAGHAFVIEVKDSIGSAYQTVMAKQP
ncbi:hypothetical protein HPY28_08035 [Brevibacillus sp. HB1.2]|uniref:Lipoprotein n=1 Tax=Brevibacillus porteri TaxID=2126350 RepID=A0ABX5FLC1_9BACL|nr:MULTISPECIES: hypothetical protein [Brevibacillus]ATF14644.1 hypothetical protein A616_22490 [Brevibacillus brevis X23]MED1800188.1 hypothetical protein [Brevibacillus porteri]MED2131805.1 hypothetical protein [Brevibacillus porteri]MED2748052.1 hypothetical protein [Brevibacillus porteri]MED2812302.1 hypothetical protein [Brevibacillus porteri]